MLLVLDTHAVLWWTLEPARLGRAARQAIGEADRIGVPTVAFWETAMLVRKRKLIMDLPVGEWAGRLLAIPKVEALPLTAAIALRAEALSMHADPADRFIVATAIEAGSRLVTKDRLLRGLKSVDTLW